MVNELALFAGAGGGLLGSIINGWRTVCAVESNPFCRKILLARQADGMLERFPIWDDVCTFDGRPWKGHVDIITGGFPCSDVSWAGDGAGLSGKHSGLWHQMARIIGEVGPGWVWVENSPALLDRGIDEVLWALASMGYDARWGIVGGKKLGCYHDRKRVWIAAHANSQQKPMVQCRGRKKRGCQTPSYWQVESMDIDFGSGVGRKRLPKPGIPRMVDGLANRVDRNRAIGNGQIPAVVEWAWAMLGPGGDCGK